MSGYRCPDCGVEVGTNGTTAGAFRVPPTIYCLKCATEMGRFSDADVDLDEIAQKEPIEE